MVAELKNKPFALIGINSDGGLPKVQQIIKDNGITWRNVLDSASDKGGGGPIAKKWNVRGWPTVILIDHLGVIRKRFLGVDEAEMRKIIDELVAEAEKAPTK